MRLVGEQSQLAAWAGRRDRGRWWALRSSSFVQWLPCHPVLAVCKCHVVLSHTDRCYAAQMGMFFDCTMVLVNWQ